MKLFLFFTKVYKMNKCINFSRDSQRPELKKWVWWITGIAVIHQTHPKGILNKRVYTTFLLTLLELHIENIKDLVLHFWIVKDFKGVINGEREHVLRITLVPAEHRDINIMMED